MSFACLVITTNLPHRLERTLNLLQSIEEQDDQTFDNKVLSIDLQPDIEGCEHALEDWAHDFGWQVTSGLCSGNRAMLNNILRGLHFIDEENLFYCEDHVLINRIPSKYMLKSIFEGNNIGWINYNTHVFQENLLNVPGFVERPNKARFLEFVNMYHNWIKIIDDEFLLKGPEIEDEYYLCFPAAITKLVTFQNLISYGMKNYKDIGIEVGFTKAWKDLGYLGKERVAVYVQPKTIRELPFAGFADLHRRACMRFRNNDPRMLHASVVAHQALPNQENLKRSFF